MAESQTISFDIEVIASGFAPSGTVFHTETFLERGTNNPANSQYTVIQSDYIQEYMTLKNDGTREAKAKPNIFGLHGQNEVWHLHTGGDYGAYASGWVEYRIYDPHAQYDSQHDKYTEGYVYARWNPSTANYAKLNIVNDCSLTQALIDDGWVYDGTKDKDGNWVRTKGSQKATINIATDLVLKQDLADAGWVLQTDNWCTLESWLTSREIDLSSSRSAKLTFSHAAEYHRAPAEMMPYAKVMIATSDDSYAHWTDISPVSSQYPYPDYKFVPAAIDLTPYAGKKIKISFRYISYAPGEQPAGYVSGNGVAWEVKNILITEN